MNPLQRVVDRVRRRFRWEREWGKESKQPTWLVEGPREQVQAAREDGWIEPGASVVDLGCGMGNTAAWLAEQGHRVWAVDFAWSAIRRGRARYGTVPGLRLDRVDVTRPMRVDQPFDVVLDLGCVHQLARRRAARVRGQRAPAHPSGEPAAGPDPRLGLRVGALTGRQGRGTEQAPGR